MASHTRGRPGRNGGLRPGHAILAACPSCLLTIGRRASCVRRCSPFSPASRSPRVSPPLLVCATQERVSQQRHKHRASLQLPRTNATAGRRARSVAAFARLCRGTDQPAVTDIHPFAAGQKLDEYDVAQVYGEDNVGTFDQVRLPYLRVLALLLRILRQFPAGRHEDFPRRNRTACADARPRCSVGSRTIA